MVIKNLAGNGGREQNTAKTGSEVMVMEEEKRSKSYGKVWVQITGCLYCGKIYPDVAATFFFLNRRDMIVTVWNE